MSPFWKRSSAFTQRISVLLPEPDGPHTTTTSPGAIESSISRRTWSLPNHLSTPLNAIAASAIDGPLPDHEEDVAGVYRLAGGDADLAHRSRRRALQLVFHLHRLDDDQRLAGRDRVAHLDREVTHLARQRCLERLAARAARRAAPRPDDIAGLLLDLDRIGFAGYLHDARAVMIVDIGDVRHAVHDEREDALLGQPRVDLPHLVVERHAVTSAFLNNVHDVRSAPDGGDEFHRLPVRHPGRTPDLHAGADAGAAGASAT